MWIGREKGKVEVLDNRWFAGNDAAYFLAVQEVGTFGYTTISPVGRSAYPLKRFVSQRRCWVWRYKPSTTSRAASHVFSLRIVALWFQLMDSLFSCDNAKVVLSKTLSTHVVAILELRWRDYITRWSEVILRQHLVNLDGRSCKAILTYYYI